MPRIRRLCPANKICGGAKGADLLGYTYAVAKNYDIKYFFPDWDTHGKSAGIKRNIEMGNYADYLIAFWDGQSRGTKFMIDYAKRIGLPYWVVRYL